MAGGGAFYIPAGLECDSCKIDEWRSNAIKDLFDFNGNQRILFKEHFSLRLAAERSNP
jgi:hypothetical protein